jgi:hypothetical protein
MLIPIINSISVMPEEDVPVIIPGLQPIPGAVPESVK